MNIETTDTIYDINFSLIQIEITSKCNMSCDHCRDYFSDMSDMSFKNILKIIEFGLANSKEKIELILSGGEPLMHKDILGLLILLRNYPLKMVNITTNGSLINKMIIPFLKNIQMSVSLDGIDAETHDTFRHHKGAFQKALDAIELMQKNNVPVNVRVSLKPDQIKQLPSIIKFVYELGVGGVSVSSILPTGKALINQHLTMNKEQKKLFLQTLFDLKRYYASKGLNIITNDPLKHFFCKYSEEITDDMVISGCTAGLVTFNVFSNGDMTPCAMMNLSIMNTFDLEVEEMTKQYQESNIIHNLLERNFKGKCKDCKKLIKCGGCRARSFGINGDYLGEDPDCWL